MSVGVTFFKYKFISKIPIKFLQTYCVQFEIKEILRNTMRTMLAYHFNPKNLTPSLDEGEG